MSLRDRGSGPASWGASWDSHVLLASLPRDLIIMAALTGCLGRIGPTELVWGA